MWKYCTDPYVVHGTALAPKDADPESEAASKLKEEKISLLQWGVAFDKFAIAASCIPIDGAQGEAMWEYSSAIAYRRVIYEVDYFPAHACSAVLCLLPGSVWSRKRKAITSHMACHGLRPPRSQAMEREGESE